MAPTQLSIVLEGLLNELGTADLSTLEAMLKHDTGAVLDAIRSTAAAAEWQGDTSALERANPREPPEERNSNVRGRSYPGFVEQVRSTQC